MRKNRARRAELTALETLAVAVFGTASGVLTALERLSRLPTAKAMWEMELHLEYTLNRLFPHTRIVSI
ncbi:MAG: hypothetical protein B7X71_11560 [Polynucleobacter sp. 39-46-10]|nr:MAG: hypothetical protein B7X71_11560 [Polynucleobacter sp. 39-46-10]